MQTKNILTIYRILIVQPFVTKARIGVPVKTYISEAKTCIWKLQHILLKLQQAYQGKNRYVRAGVGNKYWH